MASLEHELEARKTKLAAAEGDLDAAVLRLMLAKAELAAGELARGLVDAVWLKEAAARHMLISGFLAAPLAHIQNEELRALVAAHVAAHVPGGDGKGDLANV